MMYINPVDDRLQEQIKNTSQSIRTMETVRQPYIANWIEITEPVSLDVAKTIEFDDTTITASDFLSIGDKIRITSSGVEYYSYVQGLSAEIVELFGDAPSPGSSIDNFFYSRLPKPVGHPITFEPSGAIFPGGSMTNTSDDIYQAIKAVVDTFNIDFHFSTTLGGSLSNTVTLSTGLTYSTPVNEGAVKLVPITNGGSYETGIADIVDVAGGVGVRIRRFPSFGNFSAGAFEAWGNINFRKP